MKKQALVILSGGMDSAICLALAVSQWGKENVAALSFDYGQRHANEKKSAQVIAKHFDVDHKMLNLPFFQEITHSALLNTNEKIQINHLTPNTLVMGRNGLFARLGAIYAHSLGAQHLYLGILGLEAANSGYRDCSREYFDLEEKVLRLDMGSDDFWIHTPLVDMTKEQTMNLAHQLKVLVFLLENTITCYEGLQGYGCGKCPACLLRNEGIQKFLTKNPDINFSYKNRFQ